MWGRRGEWQQGGWCPRNLKLLRCSTADMQPGRGLTNVHLCKMLAKGNILHWTSSAQRSRKELRAEADTRGGVWVKRGNPATAAFIRPNSRNAADLRMLQISSRFPSEHARPRDFHRGPLKVQIRIALSGHEVILLSRENLQITPRTDNHSQDPNHHGKLTAHDLMRKWRGAPSLATACTGECGEWWRQRWRRGGPSFPQPKPRGFPCRWPLPPTLRPLRC